MAELPKKWLDIPYYSKVVRNGWMYSNNHQSSYQGWTYTLLIISGYLKVAHRMRKSSVNVTVVLLTQNKSSQNCLDSRFNFFSFFFKDDDELWSQQTRATESKNRNWQIVLTDGCLHKKKQTTSLTKCMPASHLLNFWGGGGKCSSLIIATFSYFDTIITRRLTNTVFGLALGWLGLERRNNSFPFQLEADERRRGT